MAEQHEEPAVRSSSGPRWHGRVRVEIVATIGKVWAIGSDFCGLTKWIPTMEFCQRIEGKGQTPGCVRYAGGHTFPRTDGQKSWAKERLLSIDNTNLSYSYVMEDGNMGLNGYFAKFQLFEGKNSDTTWVDWSFEMDPSTAGSKDEVIGKQIAFLSAAVKRLEIAASTLESAL
ncbi:hypothetical protein O6H91_Y055000 [Diphasiastrum complanatum]|nr:hypothetical protein O6H91_Y055000 [Diphasiastrum complanatum]